MLIEEFKKGIKFIYDDEVFEAMTDAVVGKKYFCWIEKNSDGAISNESDNLASLRDYTLYTGKHFEDLTEIDCRYSELDDDTQNRLILVKRTNKSLVEYMHNFSNGWQLSDSKNFALETTYRLKKEEPKEPEPFDPEWAVKQIKVFDRIHNNTTRIDVIVESLNSLERRIGMLEKLQGMTEPNLGGRE